MTSSSEPGAAASPPGAIRLRISIRPSGRGNGPSCRSSGRNCTAGGLLPAAIVGIDVVRLLRGAAAMNRRLREAPVRDNPVLQYVGICHLADVRAAATIRALSVGSSQLGALGVWYEQLSSASLGAAGQGIVPPTARGRQHQEGCRDRLVTNLVVAEPRRDPLILPKLAGCAADEDGLDDLVGTRWPTLLSAAVTSAKDAAARAGRPAADILLPRIDEHTVGQLLQMLMLATVVEGQLVGTNPHGRPGFEASRQRPGS